MSKVAKYDIPDMINNYMKVGLRYFRQNKIFTVINVFGLSIALAVSFTILLYVINERSYDNCHRKAKRIFRVLRTDGESKKTYSGTPFVMRNILNEIPQIEKVVNATRITDLKLKIGNEYVNIDGGYSTESEIFDVFTLPLIDGLSKQNILQDKNAIVISYKLAKKIFPQGSSIGKEIIGKANNKDQRFIVTGVFEDIPVNSTFRADCFVNEELEISELNEYFNISNVETSWEHYSWETWVLLSKGNKQKEVEQQIQRLCSIHSDEKIKTFYSLQNLSDIYLHSKHIANSIVQGDINRVRLFTAIAILIIFIASINYIILSTAISVKRAKEIGIRKTYGAAKKNIWEQFLVESTILVITILPISLLLMFIALPWSSYIFQMKIKLIGTNAFTYMSYFSTVVLLIGFTSGIYTTICMSRQKVNSILIEYGKNGGKNQILTSILIITQLIIFCSLAASSIIIRTQYLYAIKSSPGFHNKDILILNLGYNPKNYITFLDILKANPNVISASASPQRLPALGRGGSMVSTVPDESTKVWVEWMAIGYNFFNTMGISIKEGRDFSKEYSNDPKESVIINEEAVKQLGLTEPIGTRLGKRTVIGVVKDFNPFSVHQKIPLMEIFLRDLYSNLVIRYKDGSLKNLLPSLRSEWNKMAPGKPFKYFLVEDVMKKKYDSEKNLNTGIFIFTCISLFISILGLFGFTLFNVRNKTKEIGIRKVLGSSSQEILYSFIIRYLKYVIIAFLFSIPVTLFFMREWLRNFAYHVSVNSWIFIFTFILASAIVTITVFFHSYHASLSVPANSLKYE